MKGSDRIIIVALPVVALAVGFWLLVLGPKQGEAGDLDQQIATLESTISSAEDEAASAEQARAAFPKSYSELVSLGAAVPEDDDQATLIHDLSELARDDSVSFRSFAVVPAAGGVEAPVAPAPATTTTAPPIGESPADGEAATTAVPAIPTEASAAALPLGATVGPAGLPVTPYELTYFGHFFDMADLFAALDERVEVTKDGSVPRVHGRLMTIDGFSMSADPISGFPSVQTDLKVTTYLVPAEQGISAGATPAGPAPIGSPEAPIPTSTDGTVAPTGVTAAVQR